MKNNTSRRLFLRNTAIATTGMALLSSNAVLHAMTKKESPFNGYNPYAEETTDLRSSSIFGKHITVKGKIYDKSGNFPLANTKVEVWHLSPNSKKYRHRAILTTNSLGEYQFITDFPNREYGKSPRIFFKVSKNEASYFTELFVSDFGANISGKHWEENNQLGKELFPKKETFLDQTTFTFNISLK